MSEKNLCGNILSSGVVVGRVAMSVPSDKWLGAG